MVNLKQSIKQFRISAGFDTIIAVLTILIGILIVAVSDYYNLNRSYIGYVSIFSAVLYLYLNKTRITIFEKINYSSKELGILFKLFSISFIFLYAASVFLLRAEVYHRPFFYFIIISICSVAIVIQIFNMDLKNKFLIYYILIEILLLSLNIHAGVYFEYSSLYGFDPFFHLYLSEAIASSGFMPPGVEYGTFPIIHVLTAVSKIISGLSFKDSFFILSIIETLGSIFVFLVGKRLFNVYIALLAVLILNLSNYDIIWGYWITPMTVAAAVFPVILYILFKVKDSSNKVNFSFLLSLFLILTVLLHSVSTFAVFILFVSFFGASLVYRTFFKGIYREKTFIVSLSLILFFMILFISYWSYAYYEPTDFFSLMVKSVINALSQSTIGEVSKISTATEFKYSDLLLMEAGFMIFLVMMIVGLLKSLSSKYIDINRFVLFGTTVSIFVIIYVISLAGINILLPERWFVFLYIVSCYFAALGLFIIANKMNSRIKGMVVAGSLIFLLSFFMITTPTGSNTDSPIYAQGHAQRYGFFDSEINGINFLLSNYRGKFSINSAYGTYINPINDSSRNLSWRSLDPRDPLTYRNAVILRSVDLKEGVYIPFPKNKINEVVIPDQNFLNDLKSEKNIIYDNNEVKVYI